MAVLDVKEACDSGKAVYRNKARNRRQRFEAFEVCAKPVSLKFAKALDAVSNDHPRARLLHYF